MKKGGSIYLAANLVNGKVYVGQTIQPLSRRWSQHIRTAQDKPKYALHHAIRKYGASMFAVSVVAQSDTREGLNELEREWIALRQANDPRFGYNMTSGGGANVNAIKGRTLSPWHKERLTGSTRGKPKTAEHLAKLKSAWKPRRPMSQETRAAMIAKKKIRVVPPEERQRHLDAVRRRVITPELREKYREAGLKAQRVMRDRGQDPLAALLEHGAQYRFKSRPKFEL